MDREIYLKALQNDVCHLHKIKYLVILMELNKRTPVCTNSHFSPPPTQSKEDLKAVSGLHP